MRMQTQTPFSSNSSLFNGEEQANIDSQRDKSHTVGHDDWGTQRHDAPRRKSRLNMQDLSFILHPCHEVSTSEKHVEEQSPGNNDMGQPIQTMLENACQSLGVSVETADTMYVCIQERAKRNR